MATEVRAVRVRARFGAPIVPKIPRRVSGYNLDSLLPEHGFDVAKALVGSEGTLVTVLRAELDLVPVPAGGVMCPSYRAAREEEHSTRGRARLLFEMLGGHDDSAISDGWRSTEVRDALDLCLACKGCRSDCPTGVDMATYKAEFLARHYAGRLRPAAHYALGWLPLWARLSRLAPELVNTVLRVPGLSGMAKRMLRRTLAALRPDLEAGTPVIGLEPSCTAVFRSDAPELLPDDQDVHRLAGRVRTFAEHLVHHAPGTWRPPVLGRRATVQTHCHQHAVMKDDADRELIDRAGLDAEVLDEGCCGLAGDFGFERGHHEIAVAVGEQGVLPAVRAAEADRLLVADGFSCRTQIEQGGTGRRALHLAKRSLWGSTVPCPASCPNASRSVLRLLRARPAGPPPRARRPSRRPR